MNVRPKIYCISEFRLLNVQHLLVFFQISEGVYSNPRLIHSLTSLVVSVDLNRRHWLRCSALVKISKNFVFFNREQKETFK